MPENNDFADITLLLSLQPFVQEFGIEIVSVDDGEVIVEMPFSKRFSTPPHSFPASIVGMLGDVAAVSSCGSALPKGWAASTLDYTVKMTGRAIGESLRAKAKVLQSGKTTSVATADIFSVSSGEETHCGVVLATTRNFEMKKNGLSSKV